MHITGHVTGPNSPIALNATIDVPFLMPENGTTAQIELASRKVSVNGRLLATAGTTCTIVGSAFRITNKEAAAWPAVSNVNVECNFIVDFNDPPASLGPFDWMELLQAQAAQIADLEARVTALEP